MPLLLPMFPPLLVLALVLGSPMQPEAPKAKPGGRQCRQPSLSHRQLDLNSEERGSPRSRAQTARRAASFLFRACGVPLRLSGVLGHRVHFRAVPHADSVGATQNEMGAIFKLGRTG